MIRNEHVAALGRHMTMSFEGYEQNPYECTEGYWTGGFGHNFEGHGEKPRPYTVEEALELFDHDYGMAIKQCYMQINLFKRLNAVRQIALVDMCFMGIGSLLTFNEMLGALDREQWNKASDECIDSKWATQVGDRRAIPIATLLRTGDWEHIPVKPIAGLSKEENEKLIRNLDYHIKELKGTSA